MDQHTLPFGDGSNNATGGETEEQTLEHVLALSRLPGVADATIARLWNHYPRLSEVWTADKSVLTKILADSRVRNPAHVVDALHERPREFLNDGRRLAERLHSQGVRFLERDGPAYPSRLLNLTSPPRWLFVQGNADLLGRASTVAVVGTRQPTAEGVANARTVARLLASRGFTIVSGLAEGIDEAAHQATIDAAGYGIAVLGHGVDITFPAGTARLRESIRQCGGAIVSEYLPATPYSRQRFVQRNRIQAALASVVIPVQCTARSGTAHTIDFAETLHRLIVGVYQAEPESVPQNEVLALLRQRHRAVIDLQAHSDELLELLQRYAGDATPPEPDPDRLMRATFRTILEHLDRLERNRELTLSNTQWLIKDIQRRVKD